MPLLACGSNGSGQLALGHTEDVSTFTPCRFDPSCGEVTAVHWLVSSASHALLLVTVDGANKLLGAGTNTHGQLGPPCALAPAKPATTFRPISFRPRELDNNWVPTKIAATWTTSFVVFRHSHTGEEKVVASGSNDFGEIGSPGPAGTRVVDVGLAAGERVKLLCGGQRHVVAVLRRGDTQRVVGWGAARRGELSAVPLEKSDRSKGKGKGKAQPTTLPPTQIDLSPSSPIVDLALGAAHSLALLADGRVLAWGSDAKGQITGLDTAHYVNQIGATWGGSYILTSEGLWSQGANTHGQLLREADSGATPGRALVALPSSTRPTSLCTGTEHVLVTTNDGLYAGGWNEHGNLGLGDEEDRTRLTRVDTIVPGSVRAMWGGCAASWLWLDPEADV